MAKAKTVTLAASASADVAKARPVTQAKHDAVRRAAYDNRGGWTNLCKVLGPKVIDELRDDVIEGDYMRQFNLDIDSEEDLAKARHQLWNCVGAKTKSPPKEGQGRRNAKQETAYASSRKVWERYCKKHKIVPTAPTAGNNNAAKKGDAANAGQGATVAPIVEAPVAPVAPVAVTPQAAREFLAQQAAMLLAYANKNAKVMPIELRNAVGAFVAATKIAEEGDAKSAAFMADVKAYAKA